MTTTGDRLNISRLLMEATLSGKDAITPKTAKLAWDFLGELWQATEFTMDLPKINFDEPYKVLFAWKRGKHKLSLAVHGIRVEFHYWNRECDEDYAVSFIGDYGVPEAILAVLRFFTTQANEAAK